MNEQKKPKGWDELTKKQNIEEGKMADDDDQNRKNKILEYLKYFKGPDTLKAVRMSSCDEKIAKGYTLDKDEQTEYNKLKEELQNLKLKKTGQ